MAGEIASSDEGSSTKDMAQQVAMPEMGLASVRLSGSDSTFQLEVTCVAGTVGCRKSWPLEMIWCSCGLTGIVSTRQTGSLDLSRPGRISQSVQHHPCAQWQQLLHWATWPLVRC